MSNGRDLNSSDDTHARMDSTLINCHERLKAGAKTSASANLLRDTQSTLLDTSNHEFDLPTDTVQTMARTLGVDTRTDKTVVLLGQSPCSTASMSMIFGFDNDETKINVPLDLFMTPAASIVQCPIPSIIDVENGVVGGFTSLGNPVLQASYAVSDSKGKNISLGQAMMNITERDLVVYIG